MVFVEMAGVIQQVGSEVTAWNVGDKVMALLQGGGYADYISVHQSMLMKVPSTFSWSQVDIKDHRDVQSLPYSMLF